MKKIISILLTLTIITGICIPSVLAARKPGNTSGYNENNGGNVSKGEKESSVNSNVEFYVNRWGDILDTNGNISGQNTTLFTGIVATAELSENLASDYAIAIGGDISEDDILKYLEKAPDDDAVFDKLRETCSDATIYTSSKTVVDWDSLTSDNGYELLWYVLKYQWSVTDYAWHIDGVIVDTNGNTVDIVNPDEVEEYEEFFDNTKAELVKEETEVVLQEPETSEQNDTAISLKGVNYAYIFGYAPIITDNGDGTTNVKIEMAMDDNVKIEQVCAMLMRLLDQAGYTSNETYPMVEGAKIYEGAWYERGLLYMASKGGFEDEEIIHLKNASRGLVAKFVACALDLSKTIETDFIDIADNEYKEYIEKVYAYGYMAGKGNNCFDPDATLTRAEFCQLINNIIGRDESYKLILNGEGGEAITPATYGFTDMYSDHWAYETCLRATSCFNENGYVDLDAREENIRNRLDDYDGQTEYW